MSENDDEEKDDVLKIIYGKLQDVDNKLERIKSDTHNLSRIASLSNSEIIKQELRKLVGRSKVKAAILHLTKDEIKAGDLANILGINPANLGMYMKPFLGNKGYIAAMEKGRERYFQRSELVDLIGFESIEEFATLLKAWEQSKQAETDKPTDSSPQEDKDAS